MILSKSLNSDLQKYSTLDLLKMLQEYEQYKDSGSTDDGGIASVGYGASQDVALEISMVLLTRLHHIE